MRVPMDSISDEIIRQVAGLLRDHGDEIEKAFEAAERESTAEKFKFPLAVSVGISPQSGQFLVKTAMKFSVQTRVTADGVVRGQRDLVDEIDRAAMDLAAVGATGEVDYHPGVVGSQKKKRR